MDEEEDCESCKKWQEHYYWEHMDVRKIRFFRLMARDFSLGISIPNKFASKFKRHIVKGFDLKAPSGETWHVGVSEVNNVLFFKSGWKDFVKAHDLRENDLLLFTCSGNSSFEVLIFDANGCEKLSSLFTDKTGRSKLRRHFNDMVGQQGEHCSLSDSDSDDDDASVSSHLLRAPHNSSTPKNFGGKTKPGKESESENTRSCHVKHEATEEEESDGINDDSIYYSRNARNELIDVEKEEIIGLASTRPGNPAFVTVLRRTHLQSHNNFLIIPFEFAADHLQKRSHDILLLGPNRKEKWRVRYYFTKRIRCFNCQGWVKFVRYNRLREGDVCVFELMKGTTSICTKTMYVHVARRKADGRFVTVG